MRIKSQKLCLPFANNKGILFIIELLFVLFLILAILLGITKINLENNYAKYYNFLKTNDVYTIILANNIYDAEEIERIINFYIPYAEYEIFSNKQIIINTNKTNCQIKNIEIYSEGLKKNIILKICY